MVVSGEITVTFAELEQASANTRAAAGNIEVLLSDLRTFLAPLIAAWTGLAAENYQYQQRMWQLAADDLHATLLRIAGSLADSHAAYTQTEADAHRIWGGS